MKQLFKIVFLTTALIFSGCGEEISRSGTLTDFVPEGVSVVFRVPDLKNLQSDLEHSGLVPLFENTAPHGFFKKTELLKHLSPTSESLLCLSEDNGSTAFVFITKNTKNLFVTDSLKNKKIETLTGKNHRLLRVSIEETIAFTAVVDSFFIASSSQKTLIDILEGRVEKDLGFQKLYGLPTANGLTAILKSLPIKAAGSDKIDFASWAVLNLAVLPNQISATGIVLARDSVPQLLNIFKGQNPQQNGAAKIVPANALGATAITFSDPEKFQKNLRLFRGEKGDFVPIGLLGTGNEAIEIQLKNSTALVLKSIDAALTTEALARFVTASRNFRETELFSFSDPKLLGNAFFPFFKKTDTPIVFQLDEFFVFTENEAVAEDLITAYKNNATLANMPAFENSKSDLGDASSLLILKMNGNYSRPLSSFFDKETAESFENISFEKYPLAALQFSYDRDFAHLNFICKERSGAVAGSQTVAETMNIELENLLLGSPILFSNSRTGGKDVVVQDISNRLYFISESGKILWQKKLDGPILGEIREVDLFKNGNVQMAFATKNKLYVIDRNGKNTAPFPLDFRDDITQPLAVFDYDNNRDYRFVVIQGQNLLMYDSRGKNVKGFTFKKAESEIVLPPKHIRIGNKDYIVIAEENGKLNIVSRVGKTRINIGKAFQFSEIPIAEEKNAFVIITANGTKERISQSGEVSSQKLDVSGNYWFEMLGNDKVTFDDNNLRINGKLAALPIGLYSPPQLGTVNRRLYVSVTETQENQVYVFNEKGDLLPGFPVYGTSAASLGEGGNGKLTLTVRGGPNTVLLYRAE